MWLDGEWTWSSFKAYLDAAKALPGFADAKLLSGQAAEFTLGFVSAQGGCFVHPFTNSLMWANESTVSIIDELKTMFDNGYIDNDISDVSSSFLSGSSLFATGELWFLKNETRFSSSLPFEIGAVPYPVADGDGLTKSNFQIPVYGNRNAFAIANVEDGENGLDSKTLFNILYDLQRGIMHAEMIPEDDYRLWLESKFEAQLYVDAIMSVQDPKYQYFEKIFMASVTAGGGSHYGPNGIYQHLNGIITNPTGNTRMELEDAQTVYETILADFK
jgi:hypothetical protein